MHIATRFRVQHIPVTVTGLLLYTPKQCQGQRHLDVVVSVNAGGNALGDPHTWSSKYTWLVMRGHEAKQLLTKHPPWQHFNLQRACAA